MGGLLILVLGGGGGITVKPRRRRDRLPMLPAETTAINKITITMAASSKPIRPEPPWAYSDGATGQTLPVSGGTGPASAA